MVGKYRETLGQGTRIRASSGFIAGPGQPASSHPPSPSSLPRGCAASISGGECVCSAKAGRAARRQDRRGPVRTVPDVEADVPYVSRVRDWWVFIDGTSDKEFNRMFRRYCKQGGAKDGFLSSRDLLCSPSLDQNVLCLGAGKCTSKDMPS